MTVCTHGSFQHAQDKRDTPVTHMCGGGPLTARGHPQSPPLYFNRDVALLPHTCMGAARPPRGLAGEREPRGMLCSISCEGLTRCSCPTEQHATCIFATVLYICARPTQALPGAGEAWWQSSAPGQLRHSRGGTVHRAVAGRAGGGGAGCAAAAVLLTSEEALQQTQGVVQL